MTADYFGIAVTQKKIEYLCGKWKREGMSNKEFVVALKKLGLKVRARYRARFEDLARQNDSAHVVIVAWMLRGTVGHFSIVDHATAHAVWLAEPESGKIIR